VSSTTSNPKLARKARLRWDEREKKHLLLYPERGLLLNETAAEIVKLCDGSRSVAEIQAAFASRGEMAADDVAKFLDELRAKNLLE